MIVGKTRGVGFSFRDVLLNGVRHQSEGKPGKGLTGLTCVERKRISREKKRRKKGLQKKQRGERGPGKNFPNFRKSDEVDNGTQKIKGRTSGVGFSFRDLLLNGVRNQLEGMNHD